MTKDPNDSRASEPNASEPGAFEHGLHDALTGATAGLPDNPSRYEQTEARVRRNRRWAGAAVVAAAAVLVGAGIGIPQLIGPGGGGDDGVLTQTGDSSNLRCPAPSGGPGRPKPTGSGRLVPDGAVSARFCQGASRIPDAPKGDPDLLRTTLTEDVDRLVTSLNELQPAVRELNCTDELGPTYDLVLRYPDGRQVLVSFEAFGCGVTRAGDEYRLGGKELVEVGKGLLPTPPGALTCPTDQKRVELRTRSREGGAFVREGADAALLCMVEGSIPQEEPFEPTRFDAAAARQLVTKLNALPAADPNAACTMELGASYELLLSYADGQAERVTFEAYGCGWAQSGEKSRMGANELADFARQLSGEGDGERDEPSPSSPAPAPDCRDPGKLLPGEAGRRDQLYGSADQDAAQAVPDPAVAGRLCRYSASGSGSGTGAGTGSAALTGQQELAPAQAEELRALLNQSAGQRTVTCDWESYTGPVDIVMLSDQAGGQYELRLLRGDCTALFDVNGVANASPELLAAVDAVLGPR